MHTAVPGLYTYQILVLVQLYFKVDLLNLVLKFSMLKFRTFASKDLNLWQRVRATVGMPS